jgi:hypothetical protein
VAGATILRDVGDGSFDDETKFVKMPIFASSWPGFRSCWRHPASLRKIRSFWNAKCLDFADFGGAGVTGVMRSGSKNQTNQNNPQRPPLDRFGCPINLR